PGFTFNKRITIHGKENKDAVYEKIFDSNQLAFFPEGGNFITGVVNVVAFKSIDKNGMPLNITGDVKNSKNEIITSFKSIHDGMGSFTMVPLKNESYYATLNGFGEKYFLPQTTESGLVFNVTSSPGRKQFKIV